MMREIMSLAKNILTDGGGRSGSRVFQHPFHAFQTKVSGSPPAAGDALGDHKHRISWLQRENRRLKGGVAEKSQWHSARLQNAHIPTRADQREHISCVAIGEDAMGQIEATEKRWRETH